MPAVHRRATSTRRALPPAFVPVVACAGIAAALASPGTARPAEQNGTYTTDRDAASAWLAGLPDEPAFVCGTPELVARQTWSGVTRLPLVRMANEDEESPDGQPLWFDPQPRLIRADSTEGLAFRDFLIVGELNLPVSRVETTSDSMQYASHVVNLVARGFGNERVAGDDYAFELQEVTKAFYDVFPDVYDSIAIVTAEQHPSAKFGAYHRNVRNPIKGIGRDEFDYTDYFGSKGALRSVELYRDARFTAVWTSNHEIGHQWADYWDWSEITDGLERAGWSPAGHTPLLFPGEVLLGAVLRPIRRVAPSSGGNEGEEASYVIERTPAPSLYHPTTLYRMGLLGPEEVPEMVVFENQGQFSEDSSSAPDVGTVVEGNTRAVHISDILAQHGTRSGPMDDSWRRVTIVVSRNELLSLEEMDYWNFFAARHETRSGATTFGGMPAFYEATGGRATLDTTIEKFSGSRIVNDPPLQVSDVPIDRREFRGVQLEAPVPGAMTTGEEMTFAGRLVSDEAADVTEVCVRQAHIGGPPDDEGNDIRVVNACDEPAGNRFSMQLKFDQPGRYALQIRFATQPNDAAEPNETYSSYMTGITVR